MKLKHYTNGTWVIQVNKWYIKPGRWHKGSAFVFCLGDCPFKSEPSPTSADACGEVTDCTAGCQKVSMCSTRGGSQGIYITCASAMQVRQKTHSGFEIHRRHHQKSKTGVPVAPKKDMCPPKTLKNKNKKNK